MAAIGVVDPLDHLLPPLVLEVDIDVRRLVALLGDEALEEEVVRDGIDRGDAEHVADGGVSRRAAALAQNALTAAKLHDRMDGQEVRRVAELLDQVKLVLGAGRDLVRARPPDSASPRPPRSAARASPARLAGLRLARILIAQLVEEKRQRSDDLVRSRQRLGMALEQTRHLGRVLEKRSAWRSRRKPASSMVQLWRMQETTSCRMRRDGMVIEDVAHGDGRHLRGAGRACSTSMQPQVVVRREAADQRHVGAVSEDASLSRAQVERAGRHPRRRRAASRAGPRSRRRHRPRRGAFAFAAAPLPTLSSRQRRE